MARRVSSARQQRASRQRHAKYDKHFRRVECPSRPCGDCSIGSTERLGCSRIRGVHFLSIMPIREENKLRYPPDWKAISLRIRKRARQRCECKGECGLRHTKVDGKQVDLPSSLQIKALRAFRCAAVNGKPHPITGSIVVLTVMHLNHRPEDCSDENMMAGCQRCHNRYDAPTRARGIKERRRATQATGDLFDGKSDKSANQRSG